MLAVCLRSSGDFSKLPPLLGLTVMMEGFSGERDRINYDWKIWRFQEFIPRDPIDKGADGSVKTAKVGHSW